MSPTYFGYTYKEGRHGDAISLESTDAVVAFLKAHLYEEEVCITDAGDNLIFRARDGVDLYSRLDEMGIDLPAIYRGIRGEIVAEAEEEEEEEGEREPWEEAYDSIGLSPAETQMRQMAKAGAKAARTVADVARLVEGTYFDAFFETEDRTRAWGYFDPTDYSAVVMKESADEGGQGYCGRQVFLKPQARVRHTGSGEDVHAFILLDPPED